MRIETDSFIIRNWKEQDMNRLPSSGQLKKTATMKTIGIIDFIYRKIYH